MRINDVFHRFENNSRHLTNYYCFQFGSNKQIEGNLIKALLLNYLN